MTSSGILGFVKLNPITSIYRAPEANGHSQHALPPTNEPDLVVVCSWMSAQPKHIAKYTDGYRRLFPDADILLVEATLPSMWLGSDLAPALSYLSQRLKSDHHGQGNRKPVLLHMFSNSGANNSSWLASSLSDTMGAPPFDVVILDSCPGRGELESATQAMAMSLPNKYAIRVVGWYVIYVFFFAYILIVQTTGIEDIMTRIRRQLDDASIISKAAPRLYLYSENDLLVSHKDVHEHAEEARKAGCTVVREEVFIKAPHCAMLNEDADRYWNAVRDHVLGQTRE